MKPTDQQILNSKHANNSYSNYVSYLKAEGVKGSPRGLPTRARYNEQLQFPATTMINRRGKVPALAAMEALQVIAGIFDKDKIAEVAPNAKLDLFTDQSAYGPRIASQMPKVIEALNHDKLDRRAVVFFGRPEEVGTAGLPCTLTAQFQTVGQGIYGTFNMRSSDGVWGLPYDIVVFGALIQAVAHCTSRKPLGMTLNLANAHLYENTLKDAEVRSASVSFLLDFPKHMLRWEELEMWASNEIYGQPWGTWGPPGFKFWVNNTEKKAPTIEDYL